MAIVLETMLARVAEALAGSFELRDYCSQYCAAAPHVNVLYDPGDEKTLGYTPLLVVAPGAENGDGGSTGAKLDVDVWCRLSDQVADASQGAAGTPLRTYRAAGRLLGLARAARAAVIEDLDGTNAAVERYTIDRFDLVSQWPIVQCALRLTFEIPAILGADLDLDPEE